MAALGVNDAGSTSISSKQRLANRSRIKNLTRPLPSPILLLLQLNGQSKRSDKTYLVCSRPVQTIGKVVDSLKEGPSSSCWTRYSYWYWTSCDYNLTAASRNGDAASS